MEFFADLKQTKIFNMANEFECQAMMFCFKTRFKFFEKNEKIISQGDAMNDVILILRGSVTAKNIDSFGNISIFMKLKKGDVYGLESAYAGDEFFKDSLYACEKTLIMFMDKHRLITPCENHCRRHEIVARHLAKIMAENNKLLMEKLTHLTKHTTREKLLSYFVDLSEKFSSNYFELPFNKTELANYLSVDRSALSSELSKLKDEGIIDFEKRQFQLKKHF